MSFSFGRRSMANGQSCWTLGLEAGVRAQAGSFCFVLDKKLYSFSASLPPLFAKAHPGGGGGVNTSAGFSCNRIKYYWVGLDILFVAKCGRPPLALRSAYCAGFWVENLGSRPGRVNVLCSGAKHLTLTASLSAQEYEWVPAKCQGSLMKPRGIQTRGE